MKKEITEHQYRLDLRRNQSTLVTTGLGVIAFGVWSVLKSLLLVASDPDRYLGSFEGDWHLILTFWVLLGGALVIDLALRLHIGLSAIAEGKGKKRRRGYIVLALLMAVLSFVLLAAGLFVQGFSAGVGRTVVTLIVEFTSDVLMLGMCISAIRVKRLNWELRGAER